MILYISDIFTCPAAATYSSVDLRPASNQSGLDRVFIQGAKWPVVVITKTKLTVARMSPAKLLHTRLGHIAPITMKAAIRSGMRTGADTTIHDASM